MHTTSPNQLYGLFTPKTAAEYLGVAISTIKSWAYRGMIPFVKLGETKHAPLRFRHEDLEAFIETHWFSIKE